MTFAELLAPMTPEQFFAEYHDRQPLHVRGAAGEIRRRAVLAADQPAAGHDPYLVRPVAASW